MKKVMVPLDGSRFAEQALPVAVTMAEVEGGELHLLSAVSPLPLLRPAGEEDKVKGWFAEEGEAMERYLASVTERLKAKHPELRIVSDARVGSPVPVLLTEIKARKMDVVVMTTHGRSALGRAWLGSVADGLARQSPCPVLLLRESHDNITFPPGKIMVPLDGSEESEAALPVALRLARRWSAGILLGSVIPEPPTVAVPYLDAAQRSTEAREAVLEDHRHHLESRAATARGDDVTVETAVLEAEEVSGGLLKLTSERGIHLVVMTTSGRGGMSRLLLGSVANRMIRTSPTPLMIVPPKARG